MLNYCLLSVRHCYQQLYYSWKKYVITISDNFRRTSLNIISVWLRLPVLREYYTGCVSMSNWNDWMEIERWWNWAEFIAVEVQLWGHTGTREGQTNRDHSNSTLYALTSVLASTIPQLSILFTPNQLNRNEPNSVWTKGSLKRRTI